MALTKVNSGGIEDGSIVNADVKSDAAIAKSKLAALNIGASDITDDTITEAKLDISNTASDGQYLQYKDSTDKLTWATVPAGGIASLVADTSPQLGGDLDTNSFEIGLDDSHKVKFGDDNDLEVWHTGSAGTIKNITGNLSITNTGSNTIINSDNITFQSGDQGETIATFLDEGACSLRFNNTTRIETTNTGATVTGNLKLANAGDGIDFSAVSHAGGMTSELLDSYEEGTWTPSLQCSTTNHSYGGTATGTYVKIGQMVQCWGVIDTNPLNSGGSGNIMIGGLPFTSISEVSNRSAHQCNISTYGQDWGDDGHNIIGYVGGGETLLYLKQEQNSGAQSNWTWSESSWDAGDAIYFQINYRA